MNVCFPSNCRRNTQKQSIQFKESEREGIENCEFFQDAKARIDDYVNIIKCAININYSQSHIFAGVYIFAISTYATRHFNPTEYTYWALCFPVDATITTTKSEIWIFSHSKVEYWASNGADKLQYIFFCFFSNDDEHCIWVVVCGVVERVRKERDYPAINKNNAHSEHKKFTREEEEKIN